VADDRSQYQWTQWRICHWLMVCSPGELSHSCPQLLHGESCQCSEVQLVEECTCVRDALEGSAADVLWKLGSDATSTAILETLKKRFRNANCGDGYYNLLSTKRRQPGETIQVVYTDMHRLLSLAFPGQGETCLSKSATIIFCRCWITLCCEFASLINNQNPWT